MGIQRANEDVENLLGHLRGASRNATVSSCQRDLSGTEEMTETFKEEEAM